MPFAARFFAINGRTKCWAGGFFNMKIVWTLYLLIIVLPVSAQTEADEVLGSWYTASGNSRILIYKCGQNQYCGKVEWLKNPERDGHQKVDARNPDESLRSRPIIGLQIMHGFTFHNSGKWENGKVYNPQNGKTYSAKMKLHEGKLELRGYLGVSILGKTEVWTKTQPVL
ncbi:MAG: DUF2147 domain-containing protein [Cytophagaceae bacterium]